MGDYEYVTYDYSDATEAQPCVKTAVQKFGAAYLPSFYYVIFTLSLLGNGLVLFVIIKFESLRTVTNIFLLNLVGSNFIFTLGLPFWAEYERDQWSFGQPMCKLIATTTYVSFNTSVLFLMLLTIDRYLAIVHTLAVSQHRKSSYAAVSSAFVWLVCGLAGLGPMLRFEVTNHWENKLQCTGDPHLDWVYTDTYLHFVSFFLLPLVVVVYCYVGIIITVISTQINAKHRTLRIVFVILLLFFACWTPYNIVKLVKLHTADECNDNVDYALDITHHISYLYFCINPVFYTFLGRKFQNYARKLVVSYVPCLRNYLSVPATSEQISHYNRSNRTSESAY